MKKFEYQTKVFDAKGFFGGKIDVAEFDKALNEMGSQGWRLVEKTASATEMGATKYFVCTFMREVV